MFTVKITKKAETNKMKAIKERKQLTSWHMLLQFPGPGYIFNRNHTLYTVL